MKKIKLFYNGARLKDIYPHATKWQVFKYKVRKFVNKVVQMTILTTILSVVVAVTFFIGRYSKADIVLADEPNYSEKIDALKLEVVDEIALCESTNVSQDKALVKYDNNRKGTLAQKNIPSFGVMQFKVSTVQMFWKQLYDKDITNYEATLIALDNTKAKNLAKDAIFGLTGAVHHWTCADKSIIDKVSIIKELS